MRQCDLAIVGAGPAGMAAALEAVETGLTPLVIDENPRAGGQIYRQVPQSFDKSTAAHSQEPAVGGPAARGRQLLARIGQAADRIEHLAEATVWGLFPNGQLAVSHAGGGWEMIKADHILLACGAYEQVFPFPGWTLPGVLTPGAAQTMIKSLAVKPGRRVVVAGSGPFLLVVANQLADAGVEVAGVIEASSRSAVLHCLPGLASSPGLVREGFRYLSRLKKNGVPVRWRHIVTGALGDGELSEVEIARCDSQGRPLDDRRERLAADTLCVGYGFVPRTDLAQLAGCRLLHDDGLGGWVPVQDENLQTSVPGIWVAGDGGGVGGAISAEGEGRLAGLGIAHRLGAIDDRALAARRRPLVKQLARLNRFRAALARMYPLRAGFSELATDDTVVCRCEELTRAELTEGIGFGGTDIGTLKVMTRLGMGPCQGRMCWPAVARQIAQQTGRSLSEIGPRSVRPPLEPLSVGELACGCSSDELDSSESTETNPTLTTS